MKAETKAVTNVVPRELLSLGFEAAPTETTYRMLVGSQGLERTGKTNFWLTAPDPIAGVNMDIGLEGVVEKWSKKKKIWVASFNIPPITNQKSYIDYFKRVEAAYHGAVEHKDVRTVVVDTGDELWELMRLAEFGQLNPAADIKRAYPPLNQLYRGLIRMAYDSGKNMVVTHKVKELWTSKEVSRGGSVSTVDSWDGKSYRRAGFGDSDYLIQVNLEHYRRDGKFGMRITNSRQSMAVAGYEFEEDECTFQNLGVTIFDGTTMDDWR